MDEPARAVTIHRPTPHQQVLDCAPGDTGEQIPEGRQAGMRPHLRERRQDAQACVPVEVLDRSAARPESHAIFLPAAHPSRQRRRGQIQTTGAGPSSLTAALLPPGEGDGGAPRDAFRLARAPLPARAPPPAIPPPLGLVPHDALQSSHVPSQSPVPGVAGPVCFFRRRGFFLLRNSSGIASASSVRTRAACRSTSSSWMRPSSSFSRPVVVAAVAGRPAGFGINAPSAPTSASRLSSCSRDSLTPSSSHACATLTRPERVSKRTRRRRLRSAGPSSLSTCPTPSGGRLIGSPPVRPLPAPTPLSAPASRPSPSPPSLAAGAAGACLPSLCPATAGAATP